MARVDVSQIGRVPTDDWPFLYLRRPAIPALNLRGIAIVGGLSLAILFLFAPVRRVRPNGQMFFLGAGFMLLETKGVVHMALLFGATWMVNSIVFFAILTMILLSNLYVLLVKPRRLWAYYALLVATLGLNSLVPMADFLALPGPSKVDRLVRRGVCPGVLRRRDLRNRVSLERSARRRFRIEHRWDHPGWLERVPLARAGLQSPALGGDRVLRAFGALETEAGVSRSTQMPA